MEQKIKQQYYWSASRDYKTDFKLSLMVSWMMISLFLINSVSVLESILGFSSEIVSNASKAILIIIFLLCVVGIVRRIKKTLVFFILIGTLAVIINFGFAQDNPYYIQTVQTFCLNTLPIFIAVMSLEDKEPLTKQLQSVSKVLVLLSVGVLFLAQGGGRGYYMGFANALTLPIIVTLYDYYVTKHSYKLLLAIAGCFVIVALGSRGALLGIGLYAIMLLTRGLFSRENRIRSLVFIFIIICAYLLFDRILNTAIKIIERLNIYSRTLSLAYEDISHSSGRNEIYRAILDEFKKRPFAIHGIAGEYALTNGLYAHNFILELLCDFGLVFGGAVLIWIFWNVFITIRNSVLQTETPICMFFMAASLPVMLVSGTLWTNTYFWLWIAMIIQRNYNEVLQRKQD